jgi:nicotinamide-nucleotide amidase
VSTWCGLRADRRRVGKPVAVRSGRPTRPGWRRRRERRRSPGRVERPRGRRSPPPSRITVGLLSATIVDCPGRLEGLRGRADRLRDPTSSTASPAWTPSCLADAGLSTPMWRRAARACRDERCDATWALRTTGVAGPDPQDGVPVGTVFVAVAGPVASVRPLLTYGRPRADPAGCGGGGPRAPARVIPRPGVTWVITSTIMKDRCGGAGCRMSPGRGTVHEPPVTTVG